MHFYVYETYKSHLMEIAVAWLKLIYFFERSFKSLIS